MPLTLQRSQCRFSSSTQLARWLTLSIIACIGLLVWVGGYSLVQDGMPQLSGALMGGALAATATAVGALPVLMEWHPSRRVHDTMLGFGAGVMLAACAFSLIMPALDTASENTGSTWAGSWTVGAGILLGALSLMLVDRLLPHEHFIKGLEGPRARQLKRVWLFVIAIALHNVPEGLAIGVSFTSSDVWGSGALAVGISLQDIPEGLVVALAMRGVGYSRGVSAGVAILSGLVEPLMAVIGVLIVTFSTAILPWGLAAAAGAMLFVISHEIIPESHRQGHESCATLGLLVGFVFMMVLDTALA